MRHLVLLVFALATTPLFAADECPLNVETEKQVPTIDEVLRRAYRTELPEDVLARIAQHFPKTINENSTRLEVGSADSLAGQLMRLLKGEEAATDWQAIPGKNVLFTYDSNGHVPVIANVLMSPKDGPQQVACVTLGQMSPEARKMEMACKPLFEGESSLKLDGMVKDHRAFDMNDFLERELDVSRFKNFKSLKRRDRPQFACYIGRELF